MRILVSNDDGCQAPGIASLAAALGEIAEVTVVAPDRDKSGSSHSLTLKNPLYIHRLANGFMSVEGGTPSDCVHVAITGLLKQEPDMVVSGVNAGPNMGDDVLYSGTVAAAVEGRHLGYPAIAVSMASHDPQHFDTGAEMARRLVEHLRRHPLPADTILNVNVPDVSPADILGFKAVRLGNRHKAEPVIVDKDPRGRTIYWIGPAGPEQDAGPGTDFHAVREGFVSVTPLQVDLTRYPTLDALQHWLVDL